MMDFFIERSERQTDNHLHSTARQNGTAVCGPAGPFGILEIPNDRTLAGTVRDAIMVSNGYNLLADMRL